MPAALFYSTALMILFSAFVFSRVALYDGDAVFGDAGGFAAVCSAAGFTAPGLQPRCAMPSKANQVIWGEVVGSPASLAGGE